MSKEAHVVLMIMMQAFLPGKHFTNITRDRACLMYVIMVAIQLNYKVIFRTTMRKMKTHKGYRYAFGGLITTLCHAKGAPKEVANYCPIIQALPYVVTNIKGLEVHLGPILTSSQRAYKDDLIAGRMYGLKLLRHHTGGQPSI